MLDNAQRYSISESVRWNQAGSEVSVMDLENDEFYGLIGAGSSIWKYLAEGWTAEEISKGIATEYEIGVDYSRQETTAFLEHLMARGWIAAGTHGAAR